MVVYQSVMTGCHTLKELCCFNWTVPARGLAGYNSPMFEVIVEASCSKADSMSKAHQHHSTNDLCQMKLQWNMHLHQSSINLELRSYRSRK